MNFKTLHLAILSGLLEHVALGAELNTATSISFQGLLNGANGQPLANGSYDLTFRFFTNATTAFALGVTNVTNVTVSGGVASTAIPVEPAWFDGILYGVNGQARYLGITVADQNSGKELAPRLLLSAVPYAVRAESAAGIEPNPGGIVLSHAPFVSVPPAESWQQGFLQGFVLNNPKTMNLQNYNGSGRPYDWYPVAGIGSPHAGFGIAAKEGSGVVSPVIWMYADPANAFEIRAVDSGGTPEFSAPVFSVQASGLTRTRVLQITGGSDLAEPFDVASPPDSSQIVPGMVMVIDRERDGTLAPCARAYDTAVAGVLSGANGLQPGMVMQAEGQPHAAGEHPLAMTGRVWCLADAAHGRIQRGDRLTTSPTVGHAMKAVDEARVPGAVIGKAMSELPEGLGFVLVLVNLQ